MDPIRKKRPQLALIKKDAWLKPSEEEIIARYERYLWRLTEINKNFGSLEKFSDAYKYLGVTYCSEKKGWFYREWAPHAKAIFLFGDFNNWNRRSHPLALKEFDVWEIFLPEEEYKNRFKHGSKFKVLVAGANGWKERIPAFINRVVQNDETKNFDAQVWHHQPFDWSDDTFNVKNIQQLLIYECHVGMAQEKEGIGTYREFADFVLPRIINLGYTAIQIMAIAEHPYYGSFGYHVANFFAPSSRFGTPEDLKYLIKKAHQNGVAVIMDIVHSHTVKNINEGINEWDGTVGQYFHTGERGDHPSWDSKLFNYGKTEVLQFLLSNIKYWMKEYRFDGFRFDGVTSMMYIHHGYTDSWSLDKYFREGVEWDAITYLQLANTLIHSINKNAISIAEDVSGMPGLTVPIEEGGIGFDFRLGMGAPDFWIKYLKEKRDEEWNLSEMWYELNNRLPHVKTIGYCESHDQAMVGDKTVAFWLMDKEMYFCMDKKTQNLIIDRGIALHKLIRFFTLINGGQAYMNFMGNEFGHPEWIDFPREGNNWSYKYAQRKWSLVDNKLLKYEYLNEFDSAMIHLVKEFKILNYNYGNKLNEDEKNKTLVFEKAGLIFVFNFHQKASVTDYKFVVPEPGSYKIVLNSDDKQFGGFGRVDNNITYFTQTTDNKTHTLSIYNINRSVLVFKKNT